MNKPPIKTEECECVAVSGKLLINLYCPLHGKIPPTSMGVPEKCKITEKTSFNGEDYIGCLTHGMHIIDPTPLNTEEVKGCNTFKLSKKWEKTFVPDVIKRNTEENKELEWREELKSRLIHSIFPAYKENIERTFDSIEDFIKSLLDKQKEDFKKKVQEAIKDNMSIENSTVKLLKIILDVIK